MDNRADLNVFELWQTAPDLTETPVAFATAAEPEVSLWRLELPADLAQAAERLANLEQQLDLAENQLQAAPGQLVELAEQASSKEVSFAALPSAPDSPEAELLAALGFFQAGVEPVQYALGPESISTWQDLGEKFQAGFKRLSQLLLHLAWIETEVEGQRLGQTVVQWGGTTCTVWGAASTSPHLALHQQAVTVALASRLKLLRILVVALEGAVKMTPLLSLSGGVGGVLLLPLAWRYTHRIVTEINYI